MPEWSRSSDLIGYQSYILLFFSQYFDMKIIEKMVNKLLQLQSIVPFSVYFELWYM